ncbi:MAG: hypothetical protein JWM44_4056 [Bacilli bacterium]|nr:hypothetical protein [Bacilli bacterium]
MKYLAAIAHVNRPDLTKRAIQSVKPYWNHLTVIDNSSSRELKDVDLGAPGSKLYVPPVSYSFSQTMNLLHRFGAEQEADVILFMHNDAEAHQGTAEKFLKNVESLQNKGSKWGAAFTNYHTLVAFNMKAVRKVGPWDIILPHYHADKDYYRRMHLSGYELVETRLGVTHHDNGGNTLKADSPYKFRHDILLPLYGKYYAKKWGGKPGAELFSKPFGAFSQNPVKTYLSVFYNK